MLPKDNIKRETYPLLGLHCTACASRAESILTALDGVHSARVNLPLKEIELRYNPKHASLHQCQKAMEQAGYQLIITEEKSSQETSAHTQLTTSKQQRNLVYLALGLSVPIMLLSMIWMHESWAMWLTWLLTSVVLAVCGRGFYSRAYKQLTQRGLSMDTLVALSTGIAYVYSSINLFFPKLLGSIGQEPHLYFEASAMIIAFVLLGKYLEQRASSSATATLQSLLHLQPTEIIRLTEDGGQELCHINQLTKGARVLVRPSERVPIDGIVVAGASNTDESMLTGESTPICKEQGDIVYAGTKNLDGELIVEANTAHTQTRLAQIIELVKEAQSSKAPIQKFADKVAAYFVGLILAIASITTIVWLAMLGGNGLGQALISASTVLIVSCPCALGLATPLAIVVAMGAGARRGILIRDAESLEIAHQIDLIALDKTGTITEGKPKITNEFWFIREDKPKLISILVEMERRSLHPHSLAILDAYMGEASPIELNEWTYHPGRGIEATQANRRYFVGKRQFIEEKIGASSTKPLEERPGKSSTYRPSLIYFASSNDGLIATFIVEDGLKPRSKDAIKQLKAQGMRLYMLTGDHASEAERISLEVALDEVKAECLPEDKLRIIQELQRQHRVAMVGDGINDSAALAQSDLSVAMGGGSDVAIKAAMVTILSSDLGKLTDLITLSRKTMFIMKQNLFWAFSYNIIAIPLATGLFAPFLGYQMTPMWASIAMSISSLLVVLNSLRLRYALSSPSSHF